MSLHDLLAEADAAAPAEVHVREAAGRAASARLAAAVELVREVFRDALLLDEFPAPSVVAMEEVVTETEVSVDVHGWTEAKELRVALGARLFTKLADDTVEFGQVSYGISRPSIGADASGSFVACFGPDATFGIDKVLLDQELAQMIRSVAIGALRSRS